MLAEWSVLLTVSPLLAKVQITCMRHGNDHAATYVGMFLLSCFWATL